MVRNLIAGKGQEQLDQDLFAAVESLNCHTVADYIILNPVMMFKFITNAKAPSANSVFA